jgi:hypothetical protein
MKKKIIEKQIKRQICALFDWCSKKKEISPLMSSQQLFKWQKGKEGIRLGIVLIYTPFLDEFYP